VNRQNRNRNSLQLPILAHSSYKNNFCCSKKNIDRFLNHSRKLSKKLGIQILKVTIPSNIKNKWLLGLNGLILNIT